MGKAKRYEITEKDIEAVVRFLKHHDPENANREFARELLEAAQDSFHLAAHTPEGLEVLKKILKDLKKGKAKRH